jgi:uncharacterized membrane protein
MAGLNIIARSESDRILSESEDRQYRIARGDRYPNASHDQAVADPKALKRYVAECKICSFAKDAVGEIDKWKSRFRNSMFDLEICNEDLLPVRVAFAGEPDPNSDLWINQGWLQVDSGQCRTVASFRKGYFFLRAQNARHEWTGDEETKTYCAGRGDFMRAMLAETDDCAFEEDLVKFGQFKFEGDGWKYTWTISSRPWTFTAVAYSPYKRNWSWAETFPSEEEATSRAIELCSKRAFDCVLATLVRDDVCLSVANGIMDDGRTALGWSTGDHAQQESIRSCTSAGGISCRVAKVICGFKD